MSLRPPDLADPAPVGGRLRAVLATAWPWSVKEKEMTTDELVAAITGKAQLKSKTALSILENNKTARHKFRAEGGIMALVQVLRDGSNTQAEKAAVALQILAVDGEACPTILQAGAIPLLVALSRKGTKKAQKSASAALRNLSQNPLCEAAITEAQLA